MSKKDKFKVEGFLVSRSRALKEKQNNREQSPNEVEKTNGLKNVAGLAVESVLIVRLICRSSLRDNLTEGECLDQPEAEILSRNWLMKSNHGLAREEAHTNNRPWLGQNKIHDIVVTRITSWLKTMATLDVERETAQVAALVEEAVAAALAAMAEEAVTAQAAALVEEAVAPA